MSESARELLGVAHSWIRDPWVHEWYRPGGGARIARLAVQAVDEVVRDAGELEPISDPEVVDLDSV